MAIWDKSCVSLFVVNLYLFQVSGPVNFYHRRIELKLDLQYDNHDGPKRFREESNRIGDFDVKMELTTSLD